MHAALSQEAEFYVLLACSTARPGTPLEGQASLLAARASPLHTLACACHVTLIACPCHHVQYRLCAWSSCSALYYRPLLLMFVECLYETLRTEAVKGFSHTRTHICITDV